MEWKITYEVIDATDIPYQDAFDIICFKSVLGGVGGNKQEKVRCAAKSMYAALKDNGILCFCENLTASPMHQFARKKCTRWGKRWRYLQLSEIHELFREFSKMQFQTFGFLGVFGRKKWLSDILGSIDCRFDCYVRNEYKYIVSGVLKK